MDFADGGLTGDQLARITGKLRPKIQHEQAAIAAHSPNPGALALAGPDAEPLRHAASLQVRRAIIEAFATVTPALRRWQAGTAALPKAAV